MTVKKDFMPFWGSGEIKNHNKGPLGHLAFID
jgi:hypothetical protein